MPRKTLVFELCSELEQELIKQQLGVDTLKRYRKILKEVSVFGGEKAYSQSLETEFLIQHFKADSGISITDEHSRTEPYYFKCIRLLAEYYNFGIVHIGMTLKERLSGQMAFVHVQKRILRPLLMMAPHMDISADPL